VVDNFRVIIKKCSEYSVGVLNFDLVRVQPRIRLCTKINFSMGPQGDDSYLLIQSADLRCLVSFFEPCVDAVAHLAGGGGCCKSSVSILLR